MELSRIVCFLLALLKVEMLKFRILVVLLVGLIMVQSIHVHSIVDLLIAQQHILANLRVVFTQEE